MLVSGRDQARADAVAARITSAGGRAAVLLADLAAPPEELRRTAAAATEALGGHLDILVNNAGVYPVPATPDLSDADLDQMLSVNIRAPHVLVAALAPAMVERGSGVIIDIGSWMGSVGHATGALYTATKATLEQLTRCWAAEFGPSGVRVNAVAPGVTLTGGNAAYSSVLDSMTAPTPVGRVMTPRDIAEGVLFLASDAAAAIHGETLRVDGGILTTWRG